MNWHARAKLWGKDALLRTRWRRHFLPQYPYYFDATQLFFLCECLERTRDVAGSILEVGVAGGATTLFLNNYLSAVGIEKSYLAVDTFKGFTPGDVAFEVTQRGKRAQDYQNFVGFQINRRAWFDATMQFNGVTRVRSIQADVNKFDLRSLGAISFCLLDVDLYVPMKKALGELYERMSVGGILVADDCSAADARFDGSLQAYQEFTDAKKLPQEIVLKKLGVIRK